MWRLANMGSEALGIVDDLQLGSSPTTASPPPVRETPTKLPWRRESAARSRPGALPYHMPSTPSYFEPGSLAVSWLPHAEVAPSSSLRPGTCRTWWSSRSLRFRCSSLSRPPSGEPWYPETIVPVWSPRARSARCWSSTRRTSPCRPVSNTRPSSRRYLSSREISRRARSGFPSRPRSKRLADPGCALRRRRAVDVIESSSRSSIGERTLPLVVHGSHGHARLKPTGTGYMVKHHDHCYPARLDSNPTWRERIPLPRRRGPRAGGDSPGSRDRTAVHRGRALDRARPVAGRDAPEALPGRPARGAR